MVTVTFSVAPRSGLDLNLSWVANRLKLRAEVANLSKFKYVFGLPVGYGFDTSFGKDLDT